MTIKFSQHFTYEELECPESKKVNLAYGFIDKLEYLRVEFGQPMLITSACRSIAYNQEIGGADSSFHIYENERGCCAVDVFTGNMTNGLRERLIFLAVKSGWSVGFGKDFLHLDRRIDCTTKPQTFWFSN